MPETTPTEAPQLPKHKVKYKKPFQRACNETDAKGKLCGGHLKRWFYMADVLEQAAVMFDRPSANRRRFTVASIARRFICQTRKSRRAEMSPALASSRSSD